jgi:hypothetical protein
MGRVSTKNQESAIRRPCILALCGLLIHDARLPIPHTGVLTLECQLPGEGAEDAANTVRVETGSCGDFGQGIAVSFKL